MADILLIEDDAPQERLLAWFLRDAGHEVAVAPDATRAGEHAPDVAILNTGASEDKPTTIAALRRLAPRCRIIDITGSTAAGAGTNGSGEGADRSVRRPFYSYSILDAVEDVLQSPAGRQR